MEEGLANSGLSREMGARTVMARLKRDQDSLARIDEQREGDGRIRYDARKSAIAV